MKIYALRINDTFSETTDFALMTAMSINEAVEDFPLQPDQKIVYAAVLDAEFLDANFGGVCMMSEV